MKPSRFMVSLLCLWTCAMVDLRGSTQPVVAVYLEFDHAPSPVSVERMKQEAASIMKPAGWNYCGATVPPPKRMKVSRTSW